MLTKNQKAGIRLEALVRDFIAGWLKFREEYDCNSFTVSNYPLANHLIVDGQVGKTILIECTNFKKTTFMNDAIMLNKIEYFSRRDPEGKFIWVLVVSYQNFSRHIKQLLDFKGIYLVVLGLTATKGNREEVISELYKSELFLILKSRIREFSFNNFTLTYNDV
jgi:hypothetical protein